MKVRLELRPKALTHNLFWVDFNRKTETASRQHLNFKMNSNNSYFMNFISIKNEILVFAEDGKYDFC